jgi:RNA polymerase sigma-70 factor (sigma-E family)
MRKSVNRGWVATRTFPTQDALREAFEQHHHRLLRLCFLLSGRREVAEDIVQETFVRVAPRIGAIDPERVWPYLRRAAVNLWRNRLRRLVLERRVRLDRTDESDSAIPVEELDALWSAVLRLPDRQRACLALRYYEDLPERAVAEVLGCSVGTVKSHTARALARLRKELGDEDGG